MHRVALVLFPDVQVLSLAPLSVFDMANVRKAARSARRIAGARTGAFMRRAFLRAYGQPPQAMRRQVSAAA